MTNDELIEHLTAASARIRAGHHEPSDAASYLDEAIAALKAKETTDDQYGSA